MEKPSKKMYRVKYAGENRTALSGLINELMIKNPETLIGFINKYEGKIYHHSETCGDYHYREKRNPGKGDFERRDAYIIREGNRLEGNAVILITRRIQYSWEADSPFNQQDSNYPVCFGQFVENAYYKTSAGSLVEEPFVKKKLEVHRKIFRKGSRDFGNWPDPPTPLMRRLERTLIGKEFGRSFPGEIIIDPKMY